MRELPHRHPATQQIARWFTSDHLPRHLAAPASMCEQLAQDMINDLPDGPELTFGLRQLLLAKDAFVRAAVEAAERAKPGIESEPDPADVRA